MALVIKVPRPGSRDVSEVKLWIHQKFPWLAWCDPVGAPRVGISQWLPLGSSYPTRWLSPSHGLGWAVRPELADHGVCDGGHQPRSTLPRLDHGKNFLFCGLVFCGLVFKGAVRFGARMTVRSGHLLAIQALIIGIQPATHIWAISLVLQGNINQSILCILKQFWPNTY